MDVMLDLVSEVSGSADLRPAAGDVSPAALFFASIKIENSLDL
jgi:hypothetical protein